jgi:uncharacterized protein DUF551
MTSTPSSMDSTTSMHPPSSEQRISSEWQPIETAPRDGTPILAIRREWWEPVNGNHRWVCGKIYESFFSEAGQCFESNGMKQPTHWMPRPAPPQNSPAEQRISLEVVAALRFYAEPKRYLGPNQDPIPNDPFAPTNSVFIFDVTKDAGNIARNALQNSPASSDEASKLVRPIPSPAQESGEPIDLEQRLLNKANDLLKWNGGAMQLWDKIRHEVETKKGSDLPRLMFEQFLEDIAELLQAAAEATPRPDAPDAALREALGPFASAADAFTDATPDQFELLVKVDATPMFTIKVGELRKARAALQSGARASQVTRPQCEPPK